MDKELIQYLQGMENRINTRFDKVDNRLDKVEIKLDSVKNRLDKVEIRLGKIEDSVEKLETKVGNIEFNMGENTLILTEIEARTRKSNESEIEAKEEFMNIHQILNVHSTQILNIKKKIGL